VVAKRDGWISPEEYLRIDRESPDIKYEYQEYVFINTLRQLVEVYRWQEAKWGYQKLGPDEELELVTMEKHQE
jgi:hypothetical protein